MDMEEIILEHMQIREWVDRFVKEAIKGETSPETPQSQNPIPVSK